MHETSMLPEHDTIAAHKVAIVHDDDQQSNVRKNSPPTLGLAPLNVKHGPPHALITTFASKETKPVQLYSYM